MKIKNVKTALRLEDYLDSDIVEKFKKLNFDIKTVKVDLDDPKINVQQIASILGIHLRYLNERSDIPGLVVNVRASEYRQRFMIAKIIGNRLYNYEAIKKKIEKESPKEVCYYEALCERHLLRFIRDLLVPEKLFNIVKNRILEENEKLSKKDLIIKLSNTFKVDPIFVKERLRFDKNIT